MRYLTLVSDYDGTLATDDHIADETALALECLRTSGRKIILVTGRRLDSLLEVCGNQKLFDLIVAENGAVIYDPLTREEVVLANPPSKALLQALRARGVTPLEIGQVVVATLEPYRIAVQDVLWELGLEAQVIGNRGAVMVLPAGINKASGLEYALRKLGLSRHEAVGIGDAENDHSFLARCECGVVVANAATSLKESADLVTQGENGNGVRELINELIANDLSKLESQVQRNKIMLGTHSAGRAVQIAPYGCNILVAGPSGCGKSTFAAGIIERLIEKDYQVCIVDPEGDYGTLNEVVALGNQWRTPGINEVLTILEDPKVNLSINLLGTPLEDRSDFIAQLIPNLHALRARTGRPHWLVIDEAHHMLPETWGHAASALPKQLGETILVTVHPDHIVPALLETINVVIAIGHSPEKTLGSFARATHQTLDWPPELIYQPGQAVIWHVKSGEPPFQIQPQPSRAERIRHCRKYAEGDLKWHSFYFRGPEGKSNLKAQNLAVFSQLAQGIDEETWIFHLRRGDYSRWLRHAVRDEHLADEAERIERRVDLAPWQTRQMLRELINVRYTLPD